MFGVRGIESRGYLMKIRSEKSFHCRVLSILRSKTASLAGIHDSRDRPAPDDEDFCLESGV